MTRQNSHPLTLTYINVRKIVGLLAMSLPLVVFLVEKVFFRMDLQPSISAFYYTEMRWYFILVLCLIGFFLLFYQGYDDLDKWLARIAGVAAFSTAFFPTSNPNSEYCASPLLSLNPAVQPLSDSYLKLCLTTERVHLISAAVMFITIAFFSFFRFTKGESKTEQKNRRDFIYRTCGIVIAVSIPVMGLSFLWEDYFSYTVYVGEFVALLAFGVSWAVKGEALWLLNDTSISRDSGRFNKLQSRQVDGYKSGMGVFVFLVAIWFTVLLYAAQVAPFNLFGEETDGATLRLGLEQAEAQGILMGIVFCLVVIVFYMILNHQVLSIFWPLVRRNFRADLGQDETGEKEELWTLFSNQVNQLGLSPQFSVNPRADTGISAPSTLAPESSYLGAFFDLLNWIFPRLGYSLRLNRMSSQKLGAGLSLAVIKNDRKETVAETTLWSSTYRIDDLKDDDNISDLSVYHYLMIPAYFWFADVVDRMDGFNPDPNVWESRAYGSLGNALWHSDLNKGISFFAHSINTDSKNWAAYASLGRVWTEKSQEQKKKEIAKENLLLANSYLETAIEGLKSEKIDQVYFGALYNRLVVSFYLSELGDFRGFSKQRDHILTNILPNGYETKKEALAAISMLQENPVYGIANTGINYASLREKVDEETSLKDDQTESAKSGKVIDGQLVKSNPLGSWLIDFLPTLEFVLLILELSTIKFVEKDTNRSANEYEVEAWLDTVLGRFKDLPYCENPIDMNQPWRFPGSADIRRWHFTRSHYRIQFNAACFYSKLASKAKDEKLKYAEYLDLALDHLEMALSVGGGLVEFAKKDSALDAIRKEPRYMEIVKGDDAGDDLAQSTPKKPGGDRSVYRREKDGKWVNKRHGTARVTSVHDTQKDAIAAAREMLYKQGGGELIVHGEDGKIREKDTIPPGSDPRNING